MKSSPTANGTIGRQASRLRWAIFVTMALMLLLYGAARLGVQLGSARVEYRLHGGDSQLVRLAADATLILLIVALWRLTQMLGRVAAGELFSAEVIARFRAFAFWLMCTALFGLAAPLLIAVAGRTDSHRLELAFNFERIVTVGVTLVLFLLARLLERARGLDEEIREFV